VPKTRNLVQEPAGDEISNQLLLKKVAYKSEARILGVVAKQEDKKKTTLLTTTIFPLEQYIFAASLRHIFFCFSKRDAFSRVQIFALQRVLLYIRPSISMLANNVGAVKSRRLLLLNISAAACFIHLLNTCGSHTCQ
jgi:hypothetical protein